MQRLYGSMKIENDQTLSIKELNSEFDSHMKDTIFVQGRISSVRKMKGFVFADIWEKGSKIQIVCNAEENPSFNPGDLVIIGGQCIITKNGERSVKIDTTEIIGKWEAEIGYKDIEKTNSGPFSVFTHEAYERLIFSNLVRDKLRMFLNSKNFFEVQTPVLGENYNGGRSFPVISSYLGKKLGYNRTTMEEKMQALVGAGFERIFQIGSVFRSESENTFLEGYASRMDWVEGKMLIREMLSSITKSLVENGIGSQDERVIDITNNNWIEVDFFKQAKKDFAIDEDVLALGGETLTTLCLEKQIIKNPNVSVENLADEIGNAIAQNHKYIVIVEGFPVWSSPLYKRKHDNKNQLLRGRMYLPDQKGGFELGIQENNYQELLSRIKEQRKRWKLSEEDERILDSNLLKVVSGGLPTMFGFALSPDRILKLWRQDCSIDPFK